MSNLNIFELLFPMSEKKEFKECYSDVLKNEHTGNRTQVLGPEIPCTTTMLYALINSPPFFDHYLIISIKNHSFGCP